MKVLVNEGALVQSDKARMKELIKILKKSDKRAEKDAEKIVPILKNAPFFYKIRPMDNDELMEFA
jgi:hypothetical protein